MTRSKKEKLKVAETPNDAVKFAAQEIAEPQESAGLPVDGFPIVGIGASAGGLAAFEAFFSGMPAGGDPGMAFVLVQHLAPDHESLLSELTRRFTHMQVFEVQDGMIVQPNCVYIIPPNKDLSFLNGTLHLLEPALPHGQRLPIDFFFRSLAQDQHERAIGIVLSGTGSDGTQGVRAIKGEGGMVMAQKPESTEFDGMPRSAIDTGLVDYVLPAAEMPARLVAYVRSFDLRPLAPPPSKHENALKKILILLRDQSGHDFSQYKQNTVKRRVERRMAVQQIADMWHYLLFLQKTPVEVEALFRDMLIGVTSFFRDPLIFADFEAKAVPRLFANKPAGAAIRVWVCGCSTGEEAYSIAILLREQMDKLGKKYDLLVFATDLDNRAINQARSGIYGAGISADISPDRLARFFTPCAEGDAYRINKEIRDMVVFSEHDVVKDPPFSKLDLISCRNLLIYMSSELQKRLIPLFHYALNPGGILFLGTSETPGENVNVFSTIDRQSRIYERKEKDLSHARLPLPWQLVPRMHVELAAPKRTGQATGEDKVSLRATVERILLERYAPVAMLVNERGELLYIHGNTGSYLQLPSGEPDVNILKMAREGLKQTLTTALYNTVKTKKPVEHAALRVRTNSDFSTVNLTLLPVPHPRGPESEVTLYLVVLEETQMTGHDPQMSTSLAAPVEEKAAAKGADALVTALQHDMQVKEEYLKCVNEELETSNEELKSTNEEMQSVNEELQSTNEELDTSREELQSINEELATVNTELQRKVSELSRANNDMNNLLAGTGIGTIFVDCKLLIQRFTPPVTQIINLILSDVGRPVGHIVSNLAGYGTLVEDIKSVLDTLIPKDVEVQTTEGAWFLMRIRPYRTLENVIEGAVITFFDIGEIVLAREQLRKANDLLRLAVVVRDAHDAVLLQDLEGGILAWNPAAEELYGWSEKEALELNIRELIPEGLREEAMERVRQLSRSDVLEPYRAKRKTKDGIIVEVWLTATALVNETGQMYAIATTERAREANER